jgi:hypothetical protein
MPNGATAGPVRKLTMPSFTVAAGGAAFCACAAVMAKPNNENGNRNRAHETQLPRTSIVSFPLLTRVLSFLRL